MPRFFAVDIWREVRWDNLNVLLLPTLQVLNMSLKAKRRPFIPWNDSEEFLITNSRDSIVYENLTDDK